MPGRASSGVRLSGRAFVAAVAIGILGGLIGLGGGEFRLPVLILWLGMAARAAIPVDLCVSLVTLAGARLARSGMVPLVAMLPHLHLVAARAAGGIVGATLGARLLARLSDRRLDAAVAARLAAIGGALLGLVPATSLEVGLGVLLIGTAAQTWRRARSAADDAR